MEWGHKAGKAGNAPMTVVGSVDFLDFLDGLHNSSGTCRYSAIRHTDRYVPWIHITGRYVGFVYNGRRDDVPVPEVLTVLNGMREPFVSLRVLMFYR